ncbi:MAG TPA: DEAD/DEAH box helicase family protein, partial [Arachidicoccus soli]|nr:DEAD/DEAH box helicase family protein [Arachidicoccus soli]
NYFEIVTKFNQLGQDILFLCRSLGLAAYGNWQEKICTNTGAKGMYFRITISGDLDIIPNRIKRKKAHKRKQKKDVLVTGFSVEKLGIDDYFGFEIDGNHLYLLGDFTVTHNTLMTCELIKRYVDSHPNKKVIFFVHRDKLLEQFKNALKAQTGLIASSITAGTKYRDVRSQVYVSMVQTGYNRLKKSPKWFGQDIGMVVFDECHLGVHTKIHEYFKDCWRVGLTATALSAKKTHPLNALYDNIIDNVTIQQLIEQGSLCDCITYRAKNAVDSSKLKLRAGEFDNKQMGDTFSRNRYVRIVVKKYEEKALGKKTLIFNCNVEHSKKVNQAFIDAGYNAKHLDGSMKQEEKDAILKWFEETDGAILNNIDILTAGADFPSIECVIFDRSTTSLTLWLQGCGRGSRNYKNKSNFIVIDLGGNALRLGRWQDDRDWKSIFENPPNPSKKKGVAPIKYCINDDCEAIIPAQAMICPYCQTQQPVRKKQIDQNDIELVVHDINKSVKFAEERGYSPYSVLQQKKVLIIKEAFEKSKEMNETRYYNLLGEYQMTVQAWCKEVGKRYNSWHKTTTGEWFAQEIHKKFNFTLKNQVL